MGRIKITWDKKLNEISFGLNKHNSRYLLTGRQKMDKEDITITIPKDNFRALVWAVGVVTFLILCMSLFFRNLEENHQTGLLQEEVKLLQQETQRLDEELWDTKLRINQYATMTNTDREDFEERLKVFEERLTAIENKRWYRTKKNGD